MIGARPEKSLSFSQFSVVELSSTKMISSGLTVELSSSKMISSSAAIWAWTLSNDSRTMSGRLWWGMITETELTTMLFASPANLKVLHHIHELSTTACLPVATCKVDNSPDNQ